MIAVSLKRGLWLLLLFSAAVRLWYFFEIRATDLATIPLLDCETYHEWAVRLVSGDWGWRETYWMGPLYPHLLALVYVLFGVGSQVALVIQLGLSLLNIWLVYGLTEGLLALRHPGDNHDTPGGTAPGTRAIPLLAAVLFAFYGAPVFYSGVLLMSTLLTTLYLLAAGRLVRAVHTPTVKTWFVLGLVLGVTGLARGNVLLLVATVPLLWWSKLGVLRSNGPPPAAQFDGRGLKTKPWLPVAAMILGAVLMLAPATLRNLIVADDFVLLTSNGGVNLLIGQQARYKGIFAPVADEPQAEFDPSMESTLERELGRDLKGSEVSRILTGQAWRAFRDDLSAMPLHYLRKAYRFWNGYELPQIVSYDHWKREFTALKLLPLPFVLLSALGLLGVLRAPRPVRWVLVVLLGTYFLSLLPFFPTSRYRQPLAPLLAVAAACYLVALWGDFRAGRNARDGRDGRTGQAKEASQFGRFALWAGAGLLLTVLLLPRWAALDPAAVTWQVHLHEASRAAKRNDLRTTLAKGRLAEEARPGLADTPYHLAIYLESLAAHDEAVVALRLAEIRAVGNRLIPYRIGRNHEKAGQATEALAAFVAASELDPQWSYPWLRRGLVLRSTGRLPEAVAAMEEAHRLTPGNHRIRSNLASLYAETGQADRARTLLMSLTEDYPFYVNGWFNLALLEFQAGRREAAGAALDRAEALRGLSAAQRDQVAQLRRVLP